MKNSLFNKLFFTALILAAICSNMSFAMQEAKQTTVKISQTSKIENIIKNLKQLEEKITKKKKNETNDELNTICKEYGESDDTSTIYYSEFTFIRDTIVRLGIPIPDYTRDFERDFELVFPNSHLTITKILQTKILYCIRSSTDYLRKYIADSKKILEDIRKFVEDRTNSTKRKLDEDVKHMKELALKALQKKIPIPKTDDMPTYYKNHPIGIVLRYLSLPNEKRELFLYKVLVKIASQFEELSKLI